MTPGIPSELNAFAPRPFFAHGGGLNDLTGRIPSELSKLKLTELGLDQNKLTGIVPRSPSSSILLDAP